MATLYRFYAEFTARGGDHGIAAVWAENAEAAALHDDLMYLPTSRISPGFSIDPIPDAVRVDGGEIRLLTSAEQDQWAHSGIDRAKEMI